MAAVTLASKTFEPDDQVFFANLSGDFNPIHMDPLAARKTQAGSAVVHGIHAVLWSLDRLVELGKVPGGIVGLKVQFTKFIPVGSTVHLKLIRHDEKSVKAELALGGLTTTIIIVALGAPKCMVGVARVSNLMKTSPPDQPAVLVLPKETIGLSGWMQIADPLQRIEDHFSHAAAAIGSERVAAIALLSRLVGMICPGLHSIFAAFEISLIENTRDPDCLGFSVSETDERFRMVRMIVSGAGVSGSVQAFLRWPPIAQSPLTDIVKLVAPTEFADSTALIIGGSRGLGALTAKVIAAGGGRVILTYATGKLEALQLTDEILRHFPNSYCHVIPYDARHEAPDQLRNLSRNVSHLYYFATTSIFRQKDGFFVPNLLDEFIQIYVKGFYDCCRFIGHNGTQDLVAYYPSTVAVDNISNQIMEYSMAKLAGEMLCASMNRANDRTRVVVSRLPRLMTDQTATIAPVSNAEPLDILLPIIRQVQSLRATS